MGRAGAALMLAAVYYWSVTRARAVARVAAFALGLFQDLLTGAPLGSNALILVLTPNGSCAASGGIWPSAPVFSFPVGRALHRYGLGRASWNGWFCGSSLRAPENHRGAGPAPRSDSHCSGRRRRRAGARAKTARSRIAKSADEARRSRPVPSMLTRGQRLEGAVCRPG